MSRIPSRARSLWVALLATSAALTSGCSVDSAKNHYVLAEKLWADGRYQAAVVEFGKVVKKDPSGPLGLQALIRSATTERLFLKNQRGALSKFQQYLRLAGDSKDSLAIERQVGDLLFEELGEYGESIQHYEAMLARHPADPQRPEYLFRVARSYFFLWKFPEAVAAYKKILKEYPGTVWSERAAFEIGLTYFTSGGHRAGDRPIAESSQAYSKALSAYEAFLSAYPKSPLASRALYGIASCYEEMDQLDLAYKKYQEILPSYPSPNVIRIKLARIQERLARRGTDKGN
jgi:TolA-binding protein